MQSGVAILEASERVIQKGKQIAGAVLEAALGDIEFAEGRFSVVGTDRSVGLLELAAQLRSGLTLPGGVPTSLDVSHVADTPPSTYPNGCHLVELEIDPETGSAQVLKYLAVDDFGNVVNPLIVDGQVHGGVVQGIGQALLEHVAFSEEGQLMTGSFMDYAMPKADWLPFFDTELSEVPSPTHPLGMRPAGEGGTTPALGVVINAIVDALSEYGVTHVEMPATPERVWRAIREAPRRHGGR
jgi:carbon-monoxide dehydrogenase large subunit